MRGVRGLRRRVRAELRLEPDVHDANPERRGAGPPPSGDGRRPARAVHRQGCARREQKPPRPRRALRRRVEFPKETDEADGQDERRVQEAEGEEQHCRQEEPREGQSPHEGDRGESEAAAERERAAAEADRAAHRRAERASVVVLQRGRPSGAPPQGDQQASGFVPAAAPAAAAAHVSVCAATGGDGCVIVIVRRSQDRRVLDILQEYGP